MIQITDNCKGCGICLPNCPQKAISIQNKRATISIECSECGICTRVCPTHAAVKIANTGKEGVVCAFCPVQCTIKPGFTGACKRFTNVDGTLMRNRKLVFENQLEHYESDYAKPLITASGAGSTYPCCRPAPHIVSALRDGVDMVTVVTEAPLSYSGVTVKIDTNAYLGETGDAVYRDGKKVGILSTEEYGSKMLSIGGAGLLTSKDGFIVARTIVELANGEEVSLKLQQKTTLVIQNNHAPIVDGIPQKKMRVGCGSATVGLFAETMKQAADDVIVIDHHIIGLLSEHLAGAEVGLSWSGIVVNGKKSTRGRYFGSRGNGIGGTSILQPLDVIKEVDMTVATPGMTLLITDTTGTTRCMFQLDTNGRFHSIPLSENGLALVTLIENTCEDSNVSVLYIGGTGGSARGGVTRKPIELTKAIHDGKAHLTIGGANAFVMPGGGINFMVDTGKVVPNSFTWVPTPATVAPVEYTMTKTDYEAIGGHMDAIQNLDDLKGA